MESDEVQREPITEFPLYPEDVRVLRESLWHSVQRGDVPVQDRERMHHLHEQLGQEFRED